MTDQYLRRPTESRQIADDYWALLKRYEPLRAVRAGETPDTIEPLDAPAQQARADTARRLLARLDALPEDERDADADLVAVLRYVLNVDVGRAEHMWHVHWAAPYQTYYWVKTTAEHVIAPQPPALRARLATEFVELVRSIAEMLRGQRERGIVLPRPAVPGARATWQGLREQLPALLANDTVEAAVTGVLVEIEQAERVAGDRVGLAHQPGGEEVYRALVRDFTTQPVEPEQLHRFGLQQCAELTERMREILGRLGGPQEEPEIRAWLRAQPHLYASSPDEVAATYRRHLTRIEPAIPSLFRTVPQAKYDVRRLDPGNEAGMTFGYYQSPTPEKPVGLYRFNGSDLTERSLLTSAALILHELVPGHHFHAARQAENTALHPVQQYGSSGVMTLSAFVEGWAEYASGLGWGAGVYLNDWDALGRLAQERFVAQRLVVDTALNLGWWDLDRARSFMRESTFESEVQIATESIRYATDLPAQALSYRAGFFAFQQAREEAEAAGADVRDIHEAMLSSGALPLPRMQARVRGVGRTDPPAAPG
jgi:hypothetical protein